MNSTFLSAHGAETSETTETTRITNKDFLGVVFRAAEPAVRPIVVSFLGAPTSVAKGAWAGRGWHPGAEAMALDAAHNNYFSLASFRPAEDGVYRRRKAMFCQLHAVMLDDVGTKVDLARVTLPPSWRIQTSPGNFQAGYLLSPPIKDTRAADRLMQAIVDAGLSDPGAAGPCARLARLPVGGNGKHTPPFRCTLEEWAPERVYSLEQLAAGLQLDINAPGRPRAAKGTPATARLDGDEVSDEVWTPRPDENSVLVALRNRGLYKAPLGEGRHDLTCPWVAEHTGQEDSGTAYFEPDDSWPIGGFKCHHGHCEGRRIRDLLRELRLEVDDARMKPTIRLVAGEIHSIVDAAERELANAGRYYQRGGLVVTVVTDPGTRETRIQEVAQPGLVRALASAAVWQRFDGRSKNWVRCDPPARHAAVLFDSLSYPHLRVLAGLARQPYLRADGSLMMTSGYDPSTGMFGVFDARQFFVPESPTRGEAEAALAVLTDLGIEFPFATDTDRAAAMTAILTAALRPSLSLAPMFHVRSHAPGSGKSYLCALISAFATPQRSTPTTFPADDEECRKLLLAELLRGPAVIEFDNLVGDLLAHKSLCTTLTSEFLTGRILGVSKTASVSTRTVFLSSGNNVGPVQDMARRCVTVNLDPALEVPAAREFERPRLVEDVRRDRSRYVSAALTIVRAWIVAGRPMSECRTLSGFYDWSDLCRQPLLWLGCPDPTTSVFEAIKEDPDRELLGRFLSGWHTAFGTTSAKVRDAVRSITAHGDDVAELREAITDIAVERGDVNRRKLGWWMRRHAGRIVDRRRLVKAGGTAVETWRVEVVSEVSSVTLRPLEKSGADDERAYLRASRGE